MKKVLRISIPCIFSFLLLISCWEFLSIDQPDLADSNSTFEVPITVALTPEEGSGRGHFGIRLPIGWVVEDSISFTGALNGLFVYSSQLSESMELFESSPNGYHWWIGISDSIHNLPEGNISFAPQITTDEQSGTFFIDYMISDRIEGFGDYVIHSGPYLISVDAPMTLTVTNTNDSGEGSFRQALSKISSRGEIIFDVPYPATIALDSQLVVNRSVAITGPELEQLTIQGNNQYRVFDINEHLKVNISNLTISGGNGGIHCYGSELYLENVLISANHANEGDGGGFYCDGSDVGLKNVKIIGNSAIGREQESYPLWISGIGGGAVCKNSNFSFSNVTVANNSASRKGGGIVFQGECNIIFDSEARSNIYFNSAPLGNDLYNDSSNNLTVVVDTFTVLKPTLYHAYPLNNFTFDIINGKITQVNSVVYVSPEGNNENSGIYFSEPLETIDFALSKIFADSLNPNTIFLENGVYSPSSNQESFPLYLIDYVSLIGESRDEVIIEAEGMGAVVNLYNIHGDPLQNMTITGGSDGGINCNKSRLRLSNLNVSNNSSIEGGGIVCINSNISLDSIRISRNSADRGGGIYCHDNSELSLTHVTITNNSAVNRGGGIYCSGNSKISLENGNITTNSAGDRGGGIYGRNSNLSIESVIISNNKVGGFGSGIHCDNSTFILNNVDVTKNSDRGIECDNSTFILNNVDITKNSDRGIQCYNSTFSLRNVNISHNAGGAIHVLDSDFILNNVDLVNNVESGIQCDNSIFILDDVRIVGNGPWGGGIRCFFGSVFYLTNVTIANNSSNYEGGGIYCAQNSKLIFDNEDRCNIYQNSSGKGKDLYYEGDSKIAVIVDTFTVLNPTAVYAYPLDKFTFDILHDISGLTITNEEINNLPTKFAIEQNYPNPFNPITKIKFALPQNETVMIEIYNTLGQKVINLLNKRMKVGYHEIDFNGQYLASGIYYYRIQAGEFHQVNKMILLK